MIRVLLEAKQVGVIYHFTDTEALEKIADGGFVLKDARYKRGFISFTRYKNPKYVPDKKGHLSANMNVRIVIDGDKLSNKYKIKADSLAKKNGKDAMLPDGSKAYKKDTQKQAEERIYADAVDISSCIISIDIILDELLDDKDEILDYLGSLASKAKFIDKF